MKRTPLRRKTALKSSGLKAVKPKKAWRPPNNSWSKVRKVVLERAGGRCECDTEHDGDYKTRCTHPATEVAHVHQLGRRASKGRHNPDARCRVCLTFLNQPNNLKASCRRCNDRQARPCPGKREAND